MTLLTLRLRQARQAAMRPICGATLRRLLATLRQRASGAMRAVHQAQLRTLIRMTEEDIAQIDDEQARLPFERLDHERELLRLRQRLADIAG